MPQIVIIQYKTMHFLAPGHADCYTLGDMSKPQSLRRFSLPFVAAMMLVGAVTAPALAAGDPLIEGGRLCTQQFPIQEQKYNIPTHLLAAISTTESGRWHKELGMAIPWPWTVNVEGKGYYFRSKAEAISQTTNFIAQGKRSIDVGCMQVNLKHHHKAFRNLEEAFDPEMNVAYAAKFLRTNYADLGDWIKATAAYHSRTQVHGQRYLVQIERAWNRIVAKVAAARANQSGKPARVPTEAEIATKSKAPPVERTSVHRIQGTEKMRVIKVTDAPAQKKPEILVIRGATTNPDPAPKPAAPVVTRPAPAPEASTPIVEQSGDSVRRVILDNPAPNPQPVTPETPNKFVFN